MANQDDLTIGGIGADPSGAYTQIESGWDPTYADGGVTWRPAASWSIGVADEGLITVGPITVTNGSGTGISTDVSGDPDVITISLTSGATMSTADADCVIDVADADSGSFGTGVVSAGAQTPNANGTVNLTNNGLGANWDGTITYKENRDEAAVFSYSPAICVKGKKYIKLYHPAQGDTEVKAKFQWTDDDVFDIDSAEQATWNDVAALSATADTIVLDAATDADWLKLDKMAFIRIAVEITDDDVDGFADNDTYDHATNGCYVQFLDDDRTAESNLGIVSIGGIGADPS